MQVRCQRRHLDQQPIHQIDQSILMWPAGAHAGVWCGLASSSSAHLHDPTSQGPVGLPASERARVWTPQASERARLATSLRWMRASQRLSLAVLAPFFLLFFFPYLFISYK
jgi:hypothetical protein